MVLKRKDPAGYSVCARLHFAQHRRVSRAGFLLARHMAKGLALKKHFLP